MNLYCEEGKVESGKEFSEQDWRHESEAEMVKHGLEMGEDSGFSLFASQGRFSW